MFLENGTGWTKLEWLNFWKLPRVGKIVTGYFLRNFHSRNCTGCFFHNLCDKKVTRCIFRGSTGFFFLEFATGSFLYHLLNFAKLSRASSQVIFDPKVVRVSRSVMGVSLGNLNGLL